MVRVRVPATSANLGAGFDTLGIALSLFLDVEMALSESESKIEYFGEGAEDIDTNPDKNLIYRSASYVFQKAEQQQPALKISIRNQIPPARGLGSSASAIVAGLFAANELLGRKFSKSQLLNWAVEIEGHADNIVPAVSGGFTTAMIHEGQVYYRKLVPVAEISIVVAVPDFVLSTKDSRRVLPSRLSIEDAVSSLQRASFLLASLVSGELDSLDIAMNDQVFQSPRKNLIPGFDKVVAAAIAAGSRGAALSGAGPSIIAFATGQELQIGRAMQKAFLSCDIQSRIFYLAPSDQGVSVID